MISFQVLISLTIIVLFTRHSDANFSKKECLDQLKSVGFMSDNGFINFCHTMQSKSFKQFIDYLEQKYPEKITNKKIIEKLFYEVKSPNNMQLYPAKISKIKDLCVENLTDLYHCKVAVSGKFFEYSPFVNIYQAYYLTNKTPGDLEKLNESEKETHETYKNIYLTQEENDNLFSTVNWCSRVTNTPLDSELLYFHEQETDTRPADPELLYFHENSKL